MPSQKRSKKSSLKLLFLALLVGSSVVACGTPSQRYASYKPDGVFLALPKTWHEISTEKLAQQEAQSTAVGAAERAAAVKWQVAYSPSSQITAADVFSIKNSEQPIVFLRIRSLSNVERNLVSFNSLRDVIVPLSSWIDGSSTIPRFTLLADDEVTEKGGSGVHSRFVFGPAEATAQTLDQTVVLSNDRRTLYVLVMRCTETCFEQNHEVLDKIAASFTVHGK